EPALNLLLFRRDRFDHRPTKRNLVERGHALLSVEQQRPRGNGSRCLRCPLDRPRLEVDVATRLKRHQCSDREGTGNRRYQALDPVLVPDPAALEVRKLENPGTAVLEQLMK